jgi:hypothetical protein
MRVRAAATHLRSLATGGWVNYALDPALRGQRRSKNWNSPSPLPTILPSCVTGPVQHPSQPPIHYQPAHQLKQVQGSTIAPQYVTECAVAAVLSSSKPTASLLDSMIHHSSSPRVTPHPTSMHISRHIPSSLPVSTSSISFTRMVQVILGEVTKFCVPNTQRLSG